MYYMLKKCTCHGTRSVRIGNFRPHSKREMFIRVKGFFYSQKGPKMFNDMFVCQNFEKITRKSLPKIFWGITFFGTLFVIFSALKFYIFYLHTVLVR